LPQTIFLFLIVAVLAGYAGSRFIFVEAYDNRAHIFPGSFTAKQNEDKLAWQGISNSFYQDLNERASVDEFDRSNSAYILAPFVQEQLDKVENKEGASSGSEGQTRTATSSGQSAASGGVGQDSAASSTEEKAVDVKSSATSTKKTSIDTGIGTASGTPDTEEQDIINERDSDKTTASGTTESQDKDAEEGSQETTPGNQSDGTVLGESTGSDAGPGSQTSKQDGSSSKEEESRSGSEQTDTQNKTDTDTETLDTKRTDGQDPASTGQTTLDSEAGDTTGSDSSDTSGTTSGSGEQEEQKPQTSSAADSQDTVDKTDNSAPDGPATDKESDGSGEEDKVSWLRSLGRGMNSLLDSLQQAGSFRFGLAQDRDATTTGKAAETSASSTLASSTEQTARTTETNQPSEIYRQSLVFSDFSVPPQYGRHELGRASLKLSLAAQGGGSHENLLISYRLDGEWQDWEELRMYDPVSNSTHNGYFGYKLPSSITWQKISDLEVRLAYQNETGELRDKSELEVYLDALWLEVDYKFTEKQEKTGQSKDKDSDKKRFGKEKVEFAYTDDNTDENLIIKTDKKNYYGLTRSEVYFNITNTGDERSVFGVQVHFPDDKGDVAKISKWREGIKQEVSVPEYGSTTEECASGWQAAGSRGEADELSVYSCASSSRKTVCDKLSQSGTVCQRFKAKVGEKTETRHKSGWQAVHAVKTPLKDKRNFLERILRLGPDRKEVPQGFTPKKSTEGDRHILEPGETAYFKMTTQFPLNSSGEFYIEAMGEDNGYGLLDPWWDTDWNYKRPISLSYSGSDLTDYQVPVDLDTASLISQGKMQDDCDDIRFLDSNEASTSELSYWIEPETCSTTNTRVWVKVPEITGNKTIYLYYGHATTTGASDASSTFVYFNDFETKIGFDAGNVNPSTTTDSAKFGSYGLRAADATGYRQQYRDDVFSGQDLIWETWVREDSGSGNTSLGGIGIGHPDGGADDEGYQAMIDPRGDPYLYVRENYDSGSPLCTDNTNPVLEEEWYFLSFTWTSQNKLIGSVYDNSTSTTPLLNCSVTDNTYTDGEYGVAPLLQDKPA